MTPDEALSILREALGNRHGTVYAAWATLDALMSSGGTAPEAWRRLSSAEAATRARRERTSWAALVADGYAPAADGTDETGRQWWFPATVDAYVRARAALPPLSGSGSGSGALSAWLEARGVAHEPQAPHRDLVALVRSTQQATRVSQPSA